MAAPLIATRNEIFQAFDIHWQSTKNWAEKKTTFDNKFFALVETVYLVSMTILSGASELARNLGVLLYNGAVFPINFIASLFEPEPPVVAPPLAPPEAVVNEPEVEQHEEIPAVVVNIVEQQQQEEQAPVVPMTVVEDPIVADNNDQVEKDPIEENREPETEIDEPTLLEQSKAFVTTHKRAVIGTLTAAVATPLIAYLGDML